MSEAMGLIQAIDIRVPGAEADSSATVWRLIVSRKLPAFLGGPGWTAACVQSSDMKGIAPGQTIASAEPGIESGLESTIPPGHVVPPHLQDLVPLQDTFPLELARALDGIHPGHLRQQESELRARLSDPATFCECFADAYLTALVVDRVDLEAVLAGQPVSEHAAGWEGLAVRAVSQDDRSNDAWGKAIVGWMAKPMPPGGEPRVAKNDWSPTKLAAEIHARSMRTISRRSIYDTVIKAKGTHYNRLK